MNIRLNGKAKEFSDSTDLNTLVEQFCRNKTPVVAELNGKIINNSLWKETPLKEGDTIELVSFIGGG